MSVTPRLSSRGPQLGSTNVIGTPRAINTLATRIWREYGPPLLFVAAAINVVLLGIAVKNAHFEDFVIFRKSAELWLNGDQPYSGLTRFGLGPNTNPPAVVLAFVPFALISFWPSAVLFTAVSATSLVLTLRRFTAHWGTLLLVVLALQASMAVFRTGQILFLLLPLATIAWNAHRMNRPAQEGMCLGVLIALKPMFGVFAVYLLVRRGRIALRSLICAYLAVVAVSFLAGTRTMVDWVLSFRHLYYVPLPTNASAWGLAARLFGDPPAQLPMSSAPIVSSVVLRVTLFAVIATGTLIILARAARVATHDTTWTLLMISAVILSPFAEAHYLLLALIPLATAAIEGRYWRVVVPLLPFCVPLDLIIPHVRVPTSVSQTVLVRSLYGWATIGLYLAVASWAATRGRAPAS
jgi:hypothetical protein